MGTSSSEVVDLVLKRIIKDDIGKLSLDGNMLSVLITLDGKKTLGEVAEQTGISLTAIRPIVARLAKLKLIARVKKAVDVVDEEFMNFLISGLSAAIGPLGEIIVEDGLKVLGFSKKTFPQNRCAELVNHLAQEIQREDQRIDFKQQMLKKIREKGY
jgi:DNA-binding transcriptional regulator GbsR (MarR family)